MRSNCILPLLLFFLEYLSEFNLVQIYDLTQDDINIVPADTFALSSCSTISQPSPTQMVISKSSYFIFQCVLSEWNVIIIIIIIIIII
jgi:hypothetical protein